MVVPKRNIKQNLVLIGEDPLLGIKLYRHVKQEDKYYIERLGNIIAILSEQELSKLLQFYIEYRKAKKKKLAPRGII